MKFSANWTKLTERSAKWAGLAAWAALLSAVPITANVLPGRSTRTGIEEQVRHELAMMPHLNVFENLSFRVDPSTNAVTLYGKVTQPSHRQNAEQVVKSVAGVGPVVNQIDVLPLSHFDDQIRLRTYFAIFGYGPLERYGMRAQPSIRILVENGEVTLAGVVGSEMDRTLAYMRANSVPGVFAVHNELEVERYVNR